MWLQILNAAISSQTACKNIPTEPVQAIFAEHSTVFSHGVREVVKDMAFQRCGRKISTYIVAWS